MELIHIDCLGRPLRLRGSLAGWQQLNWDGHVVSEHPASAAELTHFSHAFSVQANAPEAVLAENPNALQVFNVRLELDVQWQEFQLRYQLYVNDQLVSEGNRNARDVESQVPEPGASQVKSGGGAHTFGFIAIGLKLLQSAKLIKVALAGATLAAYSWLFSYHFAL